MTAEQSQTPQINQLTYLREGRRFSAEANADTQLRYTFSHDRIENPAVDITRVENDGFKHFAPSLTANNLMGLSAIGLEVEETVAAVKAAPRNSESPHKLLKEIRFGNEQVQILTHENSLEYVFDITGTESNYGNKDTPQAVTALVSERFAQSPAHQAMAKANNVLKQTEATPKSFEMDAFDPTIDPLGTLAFLEDVGLANYIANRFKEGRTATELVQYIENYVPDYQVKRSDTEKEKVLTWEGSWTGGIIKTLAIDKVTGAYQFKVTQDPRAHYLEQGNQTSEKSIPFLETACAEELCAVLDNAGLMFHPDIQTSMLRLGEADRYGSIYTQLSREIAKWIDNPRRTKLSKLFVPLQTEYLDAQIVNNTFKIFQLQEQFRSDHGDDSDAIEQSVRQRYASVSREAQGEAAATLLRMIDDVLVRNPAVDAHVSDLPVTNKEVQIRHGACFDVTSYYVGAAGSRRNGLHQVTESGVPLLEKTMGSHTFLSIVAIVFNGVRLPKGSLFTKNDDGGFAFTRLTMFAFDKPEDQIAVGGSEISKTLLNEKETLREIGGMTISHLVKASLKEDS